MVTRIQAKGFLFIITLAATLSASALIGGVLAGVVPRITHRAALGLAVIAAGAPAVPAVAFAAIGRWVPRDQGDLVPCVRYGLVLGAAAYLVLAAMGGGAG